MSITAISPESGASIGTHYSPSLAPNQISRQHGPRALEVNPIFRSPFSGAHLVMNGDHLLQPCPLNLNVFEMEKEFGITTTIWVRELVMSKRSSVSAIIMHTRVITCQLHRYNVDSLIRGEFCFRSTGSFAIESTD